MLYAVEFRYFLLVPFGVSAVKIGDGVDALLCRALGGFASQALVGGFSGPGVTVFHPLGDDLIIHR